MGADGLGRRRKETGRDERGQDKIGRFRRRRWQE